MMKANKIKNKKVKKVLAITGLMVYTTKCCDMIAVKQEVATDFSGFSVERMSS